MTQVFVAQLELDGPLTSQASTALRDQAATWFGSSSTRHLGTEVSLLEDAPSRWLARARFVREPAPPPPQPTLMRAASWLGFVPSGTGAFPPAGTPGTTAVPAASGAAPEEVFVARRELDGPLTEEEVLTALRAQAATWFGSPRTILLGTEVSAVEGDRTSGGRWQVRARFVREPPPRPPEPAVVRAAEWLGFTSALPGSQPPRRA